LSDKRAPDYGRHEEPGRDGRQVLNANEARQAKPMGVMRYVLTISLALVVIGFAIAYLAHHGS
jgi:hypothetical protein